MTTLTKHYMCGFNGFKQIDQCTSNHQYSNDPVEDRNFFSIPQDVSTQTKLSTWSNIWGITDDVLTCYGYNSSEMSRNLEEYKRDKDIAILSSKTLIAVGKDLLIHNNSHTIVICDDGKICDLSLDKDDIALVDGIKDHVYGTKGGQILEGHIDRDTEAACCLKLNLHVITSKLIVKTLSCGFEHTLVLTDEGAVFSFGSGSRGQLGHGEVTVDLIKTPRCVETLSGIPVVAIAAGGWHSTSVTESGDIYVWGWNESGQLGLPNGTITRDDLITSDPSAGEENRKLKVDLDLEKHVESLPDETKNKVSDLENCSELQRNVKLSKDTDKETDFKAVCGKEITGKESLYLNSEQKKSHKDLTRRHFPDCVSSLEMDCATQKYYQSIDCVQVQTVPYGLDFPDELHVKAVSCGTRHTCLLSDTGMLLTSGWNGYGQLCHGDTNSRDYFEAVTQFMNSKNEKIIDVKAQYWSTCIVTENKVEGE